MHADAQMSGAGDHVLMRRSTHLRPALQAIEDRPRVRHRVFQRPGQRRRLVGGKGAHRGAVGILDVAVAPGHDGGCRILAQKIRRRIDQALAKPRLGRVHNADPQRRIHQDCRGEDARDL